MQVTPVEAHPPRVGAMDAGDDFHHRALAGAVLAGQTVDLTGEQGEVDAPKRLDAAKRLRDACQFKQRHGETSSTVQIRNCSCIQSIPSAFALVTTGPSVTMFLGMSVPVLAPLTTAETPAMIAPPWMRQDGLRTVAYIWPACTALIAGGMASPPPILVSVRPFACMTLEAASAMSSLW